MTESLQTTIHPTAIIDPAAELGSGVEIGPFCVIGPNVRIGDRTKVQAHVHIQNRVTLGVENEVFSGAVLGGTPQDRTYHGEETEIVIGDRNQFREYVTVHLGTTKGRGVTRLGNDLLIMGGTHVAHDCLIEDGVTVGNNTLIAGHTHIEEGATVAGGSGLHHWCTVGRHAFVGAIARIAMDVPPYLIVEGRPGRVRGLNVVGLRRAGVEGDRLDALREAYKTLFHTSDTREAGLQAVESQDMTEEVRYLVTCMRRADRGYRGRYQEGLQKGHKPMDAPHTPGDLKVF